MSLLYAIDHPRFRTIVREISIVPLEAGSGCVVAFEMQERTDDRRRRVIAVAADEGQRPVRTLLETGWNERLIGAAPMQAVQRAVVLGRRFDVDVAAGTLVERHWLRALHPREGHNEPFFFLESPRTWPGRIEGAQYWARAVGGRWVVGTKLLVVAERRVSIPDGDEYSLVVFRVDTQNAMEVEQEVVLDSQVAGLADGGSPYSNITCTRAAMGGSGWLVAWKMGNAVFRSLVGDLIGSGSAPIRMWSPPMSGLDAGNTLEQFRIDGQPGNGQAFCLAMVHRLPGSTDHVLRVRSFTPGMGTGPRDNQLGGTFGNLRLAYDTTTESHFLILHQPRLGYGGPTTRFCRLGHTGAVHERFELRVNRDAHLNSTFTSGCGIEHDRSNDRVLIASLQDEGEAWGVQLRADQRGPLLAIRQGGAACAQIGAEYSRRRPGRIETAPIAGHRNYVIELDGAPPSTNVELYISPRLATRATDACALVVDTAARGAIRPLRARTDAAGNCNLTVPLSEVTFPVLFDTTEEDYTMRGEMLDYPRVLYAQWAWSEIRTESGGIDPVTGERRDPSIERIQVASNVLLICLAT